jgi:hypothetical protein
VSTPLIFVSTNNFYFGLKFWKPKNRIFSYFKGLGI